MNRQPKDGDLLQDRQGYYLRAQGVWKHIAKQQYDAIQRGSRLLRWWIWLKREAHEATLNYFMPWRRWQNKGEGSVKDHQN